MLVEYFLMGLDVFKYLEYFSYDFSKASSVVGDSSVDVLDMPVVLEYEFIKVRKFVKVDIV